MRTYRAVKVTTLKPGVTVYDLGQNFSGWPEISVRGPRGSAVKLIPGELLTDEGVVTQRSFDGPVWFTYTLGGQGGERWHPRFTYSGFRYVQAQVVPAPGSTTLPRVENVTGIFIHSSARRLAYFRRAIRSSIKFTGSSISPSRAICRVCSPIARTARSWAGWSRHI